MNTTLQTLIQLQQIDFVIQDLERKIDEFPRIAQQLDQLLANQEERVQAIRARIDDQEKTRRMKELDVESRLEKMKKYQGQLLQVKTNKEYSALLAEIQGLQTQNSLTEDDILELMEGIERGKQSLTEAQQELQKETRRIQEVKQVKTQEQSELAQMLAAEQAKRQQLVITVEEKILSKYTKLLSLRHGMAVAAAQEGGVCSGCHVTLTPQMFAEIKIGEHLHRCPVCFRFLYWSEDDGSQEFPE